MAFVHGVEATLSIGGTAFAGYIESTTMDLQRELAEIRTWGANSVQRIAGLRNITFSSNGAWDATADAALYNAWNGAADVAIIFSPDAGTTTYTVDCWVASYGVTSGSGDKASWTASLSSNGDVVRA